MFNEFYLISYLDTCSMNYLLSYQDIFLVIYPKHLKNNKAIKTYSFVKDF